MIQVQVNDKIIIDDKEVTDVPKRGNTFNVTMINGKLYVNGYEYKNGKWKRTLRALWHYLF